MSLWSNWAGPAVAAVALTAGLLLWLQPAKPSDEGGAVTASPQLRAAAVAANAQPNAQPSYREAVRAAAPAVVNIYTAKKMPRDRGWLGEPRHDYGDGVPQRATSLGSGVVWRADGYILTNDHVIEGADEIAVVAAGSLPMPARVVGTDPETDLAVLRVQARDLPVISRGNSASLEVGDVVLAIGNPFGVGQTVTQGIVSATGRNHLGINTFENFIQTDAAINPGNSGGALIDASGRLVGINTAIYTQSQGSVGIGFAIPIALAGAVADELIGGGRVRRGWLGIQTQDVDARLAEGLALPVRSGALVMAVEVGGPAARSGLKAGDVVVQLNGKPVADSQALISLAAAAKPGETAALSVNRRGTKLTLSIALGQRPLLRREQT